MFQVFWRSRQSSDLEFLSGQKTSTGRANLVGGGNQPNTEYSCNPCSPLKVILSVRQPQGSAGTPVRDWEVQVEPL